MRFSALGGGLAKMSRLHLLSSAVQLLGEIASGLLAGASGILAYRSVTLVLKQRGAVAMRSIRKIGR
ncbi:MAG: hypothetical protein NVS1B3_15740 [Candidatus Dormibacteraceae bacterium]